jgi:hypothetical protein
MTHDHGSEYQVKIVHEDETEELSGWMNCPEKVAQAITVLRGSSANAHWLQIRNIVCHNCLDRKLKMVEFPLTPTVAENSRFQTDRTRFRSPQAAHLRSERSGSKVGAMSQILEDGIALKYQAVSFRTEFSND